VAQTIRPLKWIVVSDGSTDGTDDIVRRYAAEHRWIALVREPERAERHFAGKVHAFNAGYVKAKDLPYDVIGNLDADITFDPEYLEFLLSKFVENPRLGVAGTPFREELTQYDYRFTSSEHVSGACQLFRRQCFEEIGGYVPIRIGGVDLVAVLTARMKGWVTRTFPEKSCVHHRRIGTASRNSLMVALKGGRGDYMLGGHPVWESFRCIYQMTRRPLFLGGMLRLTGFLWAMATRVEKVVPARLVEFRRAEQIRRLRTLLGDLVMLRFSQSRGLQSDARRAPFRRRVTRNLQRIFWLYLTKNFYITSLDNSRMVEGATNYDFIPITPDNCGRVVDFRSKDRALEYRDKLAEKELGFFAAIDGKMVGSIWATLNRSLQSTVVRKYMQLQSNQALIHDIVTGEKVRGIGIGPFMVARMASILLNSYGVSMIVVDVNVRNRRSLRMMEKVGARMREKMFYVSAFGSLVWAKRLRDYSHPPSVSQDLRR